MESATFWEETTAVRIPVKFESCSASDVPLPLQSCKEEQSLFQFCDGNLNFATVATSEDDEFNFNKKKISRDPMSHRIIEKRRRDRMNNCLADLSRLIPADYLKKGRGRIEKTEIIEMAIKHMKHLQARASRLTECEDAESTPTPASREESTEMPSSGSRINTEHYRLGYQECLSETMHFLVEVEGFYPGDALCVQIINHLQKHCDKILKGDHLNFPRTHGNETTSNSSGSSGSYPTHHHHPPSSLHSNAHSSSGSPLSCKDDQSQPPTEEGGYEEGVVDLTSPGPHLPQATPGAAARHRAHDVAASSAASLYKFKNNIKQRFSAEHHEENGALKRRRYDVPHDAPPRYDMPHDAPRRHSDTCSVPSSPPSPEPPHSPPPRTPNVPIFALHAKGSYYIPLTLDADLLTPYFNELNVSDETPHQTCDNSTTLVLHPVTISVNFKHATHHKVDTRHGKGLTTWRNDSNGFVPLSNWYQNERHPMTLPPYNKNM